mmetsp:Transcript_28639/g.63150  ORF Transcript_28639/g.63150 Transcript_28639/m.63150 type:complete len:295 (-) Transcript_28639:653-1537(-)
MLRQVLGAEPLLARSTPLVPTRLATHRADQPPKRHPKHHPVPMVQLARPARVHLKQPLVQQLHVLRRGIQLLTDSPRHPPAQSGQGLVPLLVRARDTELRVVRGNIPDKHLAIPLGNQVFFQLAPGVLAEKGAAPEDGEATPVVALAEALTLVDVIGWDFTLILACQGVHILVFHPPAAGAKGFLRTQRRTDDHGNDHHSADVHAKLFPLRAECIPGLSVVLAENPGECVRHVHRNPLNLHCRRLPAPTQLVGNPVPLAEHIHATVVEQSGVHSRDVAAAVAVDVHESKGDVLV